MGTVISTCILKGATNILMIYRSIRFCSGILFVKNKEPKLPARFKMDMKLFSLF